METDDDEDTRDNRNEHIRRYLHGIQREIVGNQHTAAEMAGLDPGWITVLREETGAMDARPLRLLWQDDLPSRIADSLEPYRDRFEASYSEIMNAVEMGLVTHK